MQISKKHVRETLGIPTDSRWSEGSSKYSCGEVNVSGQDQPVAFISTYKTIIHHSGLPSAKQQGRSHLNFAVRVPDQQHI